MLFPRFEALKTRITVDGAWFKTRYGSSLEDYYSRSLVLNSEPYPYVGIFFNGGQNERELLNTNIQIDTHVPDFRLLVSLSIQTNWFQQWQALLYDGQPDAYIDNYGVVHDFTDANRSDPVLRHLVKTFTSAYFLPEREAIDVGVNLKVSKEIGDHVRFSFYVNRLISYLPEYTSRFNTTNVRSEVPYFGMEIKLSI